MQWFCVRTKKEAESCKSSKQWVGFWNVWNDLGNIEQFLGEWYEIQRLELDELLNADCVHVNYAMNADGSTVNVRQRMQILENSPRTIEKRGYARYIDPTGRLVMIYNETDPSMCIFNHMKYSWHIQLQTIHLLPFTRFFFV